MHKAALLVFFPILLAGQTPPNEAKPALEGQKKEDKVLARIGETAYRESDFELYLAITLQPQQLQQMENGGREKFRKRFLESHLLAAKARKDGLEKAEVFRKRVAAMEMQMLIQELMKKEAAALQVEMNKDDSAVKAYYDRHVDAFRTAETFSVRHILVNSRSGFGQNAKELSAAEIQAKLSKLQTELLAGKRIKDLAKDFSDDPGSKDKGGLYENVAFGSFAPEFEEAVRGQEIGKVGEPVKTKYGYHLLQVEKRSPGEILSFEKVKDKAYQMALQAKRIDVFQAFLHKIKQELGYTEPNELPPH